MSVYRRTPGGPYHVEVEWRGYARIRLATGTRHKSRAEAKRLLAQRVAE